MCNDVQNSFSKSSFKVYEKQDKKTQERLLRAISQLPMGTDIKKLQGLEMYRMRVGDMRVLYTIDDVVMVISIENIDNRGDVYKRL